MVFFKRRLPSRFRPTLGGNERVVAWAMVGEDRAVVATTAGLHLPEQTDRLGWHEIHKATWTGRELIIVPGRVVEPDAGGYQVVADQDPVIVPLPDPGDVPKTVRARVTASVSFSAHESLPGGGAWVVARRVPGVDGLRWMVRYDPGTDPAAPEVRDATAALVTAYAAAQRAGNALT